MSQAFDDVVAVQQVVARERRARDLCLWNEMLACYLPDSRVDISWTQCSGPEFVELSRQSYEKGARSVHTLSTPVVWVNGDRAVSDAGCAITGQVKLDGVDATMVAHNRLVERLEKSDGEWRIASLTCVYQMDNLAPTNPSDHLQLDAERLATYRPSYAALSYWVEQSQGAAAVTHDLPGADRPESVQRVYDDHRAWLNHQ